MLREAALVRKLRILFLDVRRIRQHEAAQLRRGGRAIDRPLETLRDETRQPAGVIDVRVGEDDGVDGVGRDRQRAPIALAQLLETLEQTAIDEDALAVNVDEMLG